MADSYLDVLMRLMGDTGGGVQMAGSPTHVGVQMEPAQRLFGSVQAEPARLFGGLQIDQPSSLFGGLRMDDIGGLVGRGLAPLSQSPLAQVAKAFEGKNQKTPPAPSAGPGTAVSGVAPDQQATAQTIVADAIQRFGPAAGPVVAAVLVQEGGMSGKVGDTNLPGVGSHGPFQFYGPNGQLSGYAAARGLSLEQAGAQARANPQDAANWAFDAYMGQALQRGIAAGHSGEDLLRDVLAVQNPGALTSPTHLAGYQRALQAQGTAGWAQGTGAVAPAATQGSRILPGSPLMGGIEMSVLTPWQAPMPGHPVPHHRGLDLRAADGSNASTYGKPVMTPMSGTVVYNGYDSYGGNGVIIQGDDGRYHHFYHLQPGAPLRYGDRIERGQQLGVVGWATEGSDSHLHYEVADSANARRTDLDPRPYVYGGP